MTIPYCKNTIYRSYVVSILYKSILSLIVLDRVESIAKYHTIKQNPYYLLIYNNLLHVHVLYTYSKKLNVLFYIPKINFLQGQKKYVCLLSHVKKI